MNNLKEKTYNLLRKTQKYTGTDNIYLAKGGFWLTLGKMVGLAASLLLALAFANLLDPVIYGNYKYILSLVGLLAIFSLTDTKTAVSQAVARGLEGSFYSMFKTKLRWGSLGSLVAISAAVYYWFRGNEILPVPLLIAAVFLPFMEAFRVYSSFLGGKKLFDKDVQYSIGSQFISASAMIAALFLTQNIFWLIIVYFVSHTSANIFFYYLTKFKLSPNKQEDPRTMNYAMHLSAVGIISAIGSYLDKILLFTFVGSSQLAIYSFAVLLPEQIKSVAGNLNELALPKLASRPEGEIRATIMKKLLRVALVIIPIIIIYIVAAPFVYKLLFPKYLESIPYSQAFILSLVSLPTYFLSTVFEAKMMKKEIYSLKLIVSSSRVVLFLILIPLYGLWGVITAFISAEIISIFTTLWLFRRI